MIDGLIRFTLVSLTVAITFVTLLPLSGSHAWWVRMWDFPRVQLAIGGALVCLAILFLFSGTQRMVLALLLLVCSAYQTWRIFPYTPLASTELRLAKSEQCEEIISLFAANVLMQNTDYAGLIREIDAVDPDILLLMETDEAWTAAVEPVLSRYDTVIREPLDNHYGLVFATRLKANKAEAVYLVNDDTPAVFAELTTKAGKTLRYVGLHPRPPVPGNDTDERDAQILFAARFARKSNVPLIAMGDFNDAAWSDTAHLFKTVGEYLDPRIGRGLYASFDARSKLLRVPIDHMYVTKEVAVASFGRGNSFGSDHFPMIAKICLDEALADALNNTPPPLSDKERDRADEIVTARTTARGLSLD